MLSSLKLTFPLTTQYSKYFKSNLRRRLIDKQGSFCVNTNAVDGILRTFISTDLFVSTISIVKITDVVLFDRGFDFDVTCASVATVVIRAVY